MWSTRAAGDLGRELGGIFQMLQVPLNSNKLLICYLAHLFLCDKTVFSICKGHTIGSAVMYPTNL